MRSIMNKKVAFIVFILSFAIMTADTLNDIIWQPIDSNAPLKFYMVDEEDSCSISGLEAKIEFHPTKIKKEDWRIYAKADANTVNTGISVRDKHIKSAKSYLHCKKYPNIIFESKNVKETKDGYVALGNLTIKNVTKEVEMPFTFVEKSENEGIFMGTMDIKFSDFNVQKPKEKYSTQLIIDLKVPVKL